MFDKLKDVLKKSYAPYSKFHVGAIIVTNDNKEYTGVNVENASFGATICAERVAIGKAISDGYRKNDFKEIHILNDGGKKAMPCFLCRQLFVEFFNMDTKIYVYDINGNVEEFSLEEVCPYPFKEEDLK